MANGTGKGSEPRQPKTPLAELKIDAQTMNMKTVIKCANAKDRAKSIAAQLAKVHQSSLLAVASENACGSQTVLHAQDLSSHNLLPSCH